MCFFSKFKNVLGVPGKGIHKYRFLNTGAIDYFGTLIGAFLLTYITKIPLVLTTIILFLLGLIFHFLFGVETDATKFLGIKC
jgi:hypothetical protein